MNTVLSAQATITSGRRRRGGLTLGLVAGLGLALLQAVSPASPASAAGPLLSQGQPVVASSTESAAFPAASVVDGNPGTRWSSAFTDPQTIQIDLGSTKVVDQVVLNWETAYARAFTVQVSSNGTSWTDVHRTAAGAGGIQTLPVSGSGRYVRLQLTTRATQWGYSLWEFQVFGTTPGTDPTPTPTVTDPGTAGLLSYRKAGAASSDQDDAHCSRCTVANAFDLDPATRWATSSTTGWVDPGWIWVDLAAPAQITRVVLQWDPAYATTYKLQVSDDTANWRDLYTTTTGKGFKETLDVSGSGRYVRMYGTARSSSYGYSLWEFQVYGTGGAPTAPPVQPADPSFPATNLVWADEFNGANGAAPDAAKWTPEIGPGVNNELQYYTNNNNAKLDGNGHLVIQARREVTPGSSCPGGPCQYTSGRLNTHGKYSVQYGHIEARVKVSGTQGLWPAFWMLGSNFFDTRTPWPDCGEIDIMEHIGKVANSTYSTLHAPAYNGAGGFGAAFDLGSDVSAGFHVFGVDWDSRHMTFSVDGNSFFTVDRAKLETTRGPWVFDHPFFIILNNAVGGDWPGSPDGTTVLPQDLVIDYVRVYR